MTLGGHHGIYQNRDAADYREQDASRNFLSESERTPTGNILKPPDECSLYENSIIIRTCTVRR